MVLQDLIILMQHNLSSELSTKTKHELMIMARRQKWDIIADILKIAAMGSKKTRLVYLSNLNFTILKEYFDILLRNELIEISNDEIYTTFKGFFYLEKYEEISNLLNTDNNDSKIDVKPEVKEISQKSIQ